MDSALGAALEIPKSALDKIQEADDKLEALKKKASDTANGVTTSFNNMAIGTKPFLDALDQVIAKLGVINASAANAGNGLGASLGNASTNAQNMGGSISQAAQNIDAMVKQLAQMNGTGTSGIMQAVLAFQRLQEATKGTSGKNIAELKEAIREIDKQLNDTSLNLTRVDQDALNKRKAILRDELKYQQQINEERVVSFQKALDRMLSAEQSYTNKQKKAAQDRAKSYKQKNYSNNTTYQGALDFSSTANTLNRQIRAIEYLKEARLKLSQADENYKQKLSTLNDAISRHAKNLNEAGINARNLGEQYSYLSGYISRLAQRTAVVFSMTAAKSFVENIAEVRGQFELSERSLEAILQNKPKADEIFNKTVELAVKSPFRIKDLVDYTRQLSAYRIESDKLYDTTKRLADVSAGLGVDMGRLILAYGQVKAAAYLRGSEVRQFTEAGINMYGELQQYFKEVKGEAYTTAQIVDMISKRKVTFEDVEAIFQRMTDKGGTFYNMQEIQAETLQGKISNLHDAFDVMLNDIGKANEGTFKGAISAATTLLDNWKALASAGGALITILITLKARSMFMKSTFGKAFMQASGSNVEKGKAAFVNAFGSMEKAVKSFGAVAKTSLVGLGIFAVIEAITTVYDKYQKYNEAIEKSKEETIKAQGAIGAITGSYNELANAAGKANDKLKGKDLEKNISDRRAALQKLIDLAAKDGLTFKINVEDVKDSELDKTFEEVKKKYKNFIDDIEVIRRNYAKNDNWNTWFTDGLDDDADDYKDAVVDILAQSSKMELAVAAINANYDKATEATKKYFDVIRAGQHDGESNLDYWKRMSDALQQINRISTGSDYLSPSWLKDVQGNISDMIKGFQNVKDKGDELGREFDAVFGDLRTKYKNDPIQIQAVIDKIAAEKDWNQYERDLAYKHFGIYVSINKNNMEKEVKWVDDYLSDFFAKKKYGISLVVKEVTDDKALEDFLSKGDEAAKSAKNWAELEKRIAAVGKNTKTIKVDDSIRKMFKAGDPRISGATIDVSTLKQMIKEYKKAATATSNALGVDPFEKDNKKHQKEIDKQQRDILQERINLLKDMNSKYDELIKTESKEQALTDTRKYFKEAAQNVGWNANDILPDDSSVAKRIRELGATAKDVAKRGGYFRIAGDIEFKIRKEKFDELKEDISKNIEGAFSQLDLYKKLKDSGLNDEAIKSMFGDMVTSFKDVGETINNEFNRYTFEAYAEKYGEDFNKWGDKVIAQYNADLEKTAEVMAKSGSDTNKQYFEQKRKLEEKEAQDQVSQAQELIKAYKQRLTEQLQLDKWYYSERMNIQENESLKKDPDLQKQLTDNLTSDYRKKQADLDWKEFQNSDTYISIFENLDHTSGKVLDYMIDKLKNVREQLKGLDPTQVKAVTEQIQKLEETKNARNPFKSLVNGYKEMIKAHKEYKKLGGDKAWVSINKQNDAEKKDIKASDDRVAQLEAEYNQSLKNTKLTEEQRNNLKTNLGFEKAINAQKKAQNKKTQESVEELENARGASENAQNKFATSVTSVTDMVSAMGQAFSSLASNLGVSDSYLSDSINMLDHAGQLVGSIYSKNWAGVVSNAVGIIGDMVNLFTNESDIDKKIEEIERSINHLQYAYEGLKQSMDDAFSTEKLSDYTDKSIETLKSEQRAYKAMIEAERGRKKPDDSKIQQWQQEIQTLDKTIKELGESLTESLGGFGSEANYKSAAQEFADAWVDAFNDGSDALDALNDKFDDYFNTLLKKQLMYRASQKYIEPILKAFDDAVAQGSAGGNNGYEITSEELENIQKLKDTNLKAFNDYAESLMKVLGVTPSGSSTLSNLQQGIQSVTETTAQALESILNSMRFYVAQEQSDVAAIRLILEQRLGAVTTQAVDGGASNQMIALMEQQAGYLKQICDNWGYVMKSGHSQGGKGLKVFMN